MNEIKTKIHGREVTLEVTLNGQFVAKVDGVKYSAGSLQSIRKKVAAALEETREPIPIWIITSRSFSDQLDAKPATLVNFSNDCPVVRYRNGETEVLSRWHSLYKTSVSVRELRRLQVAKKKASEAEARYVGTHRIDRLEALAIWADEKKE